MIIPTDQDIQQLLSSIVSRTIKLLRKRGFLSKEGVLVKSYAFVRFIQGSFDPENAVEYLSFNHYSRKHGRTKRIK